MLISQSLAQNSRNINLDVLRGIAIILVLFNHWDLYQDNFYLAPFLKTIKSFGWIGVDLFFVLSGYLVSGLFFYEYKKYKDLRIKRFLIRRAFKIYPTFYFLMLFTIIYYVIRNKPFQTQNLLAELFFYQNYQRGIWDHTWSLAIEEHFYLILPFVLLYLKRKDQFELYPKLVAIILLLVLFTRICSLFILKSTDNYLVKFPTHLRIDSLFYGSLISYITYFNAGLNEWIIKYKKGIFLFSFIALVLLVYFTSDTNNIYQVYFTITIGYTLYYFLFGSLMISFINTNTLTKLPFIKYILSIMAWIGVSSYPIYLMHLAVKFWGIDIIEKILGITLNDFFATVSYFILSVLVGKFIGLIIERPFLKIREKLYSN